MINELATVEFCGSDFMVFYDGELYKDQLTHNGAVHLANTINTFSSLEDYQDALLKFEGKTINIVIGV